jgi:hypothetical protein
MIVNAWKGMDPKPRVMDRARTLFMAELLQFLRDPGVGDALVLLSAAKYDKGFPQGLDSIPAEIRTLIKAALIRMWERATWQVNVFLRAQYEPHYNGSLCRPDATAK